MTRPNGHLRYRLSTHHCGLSGARNRVPLRSSQQQKVMDDMTLTEIKQRAEDLGLVVLENRLDDPDAPSMGGFWVVDSVTGELPWPDGNFATCMEELDYVIGIIEEERSS